ncbi:cell envelope integrity EipB family protein [Desertibaculum subflavum]|uniref:cell envelope integrity EipB family protein n=1 Tax=Desertibaculum subflavum TaxID=2268458 RepID=UPI000E670942
MPIRLRVAFVLALISLPAAVSRAADSQIVLAPHRAVYELTQSRGDASAAVAVRGRLAIEVQDTCEGHTTNQRFWTEMQNAEGTTSISDFSLSSWESKDGKRFRFQMRNEVDGETIEEYTGTAERRPDGTGAIEMSKPATATMELPEGTVFPNHHLIELIRHAIAGDRFVSIRVFDGSGEDGLFETGGSIGKALPPEEGSGPILAPLKGLRSWPFRVAFFPLLTKAEEPQYEIGFRMYENGVSADLVLDYSSYALKGELVRLEMLPGGC